LFRKLLAVSDLDEDEEAQDINSPSLDAVDVDEMSNEAEENPDEDEEQQLDQEDEQDKNEDGEDPEADTEVKEFSDVNEARSVFVRYANGCERAC
jgi:hypothetical protein